MWTIQPKIRVKRAKLFRLWGTNVFLGGDRPPYALESPPSPHSGQPWWCRTECTDILAGNIYLYTWEILLNSDSNSISPKSEYNYIDISLCLSSLVGDCVCNSVECLNVLSIVLNINSTITLITLKLEKSEPEPKMDRAYESIYVCFQLLVTQNMKN